MGGMQVLEWAATYPERVLTAVPIAAAAQHSAQNIAFHEVGRQAIMADPNWCGGNYYASDIFPDRGLAIARMVAHITYLSEPSLQTKFGRRLQDRESITFGFDADFQVEVIYDIKVARLLIVLMLIPTYILLEQWIILIYLNALMVDWRRLFEVQKQGFVLFPSLATGFTLPLRAVLVVHALNSVAANVSFAEIRSDKGHDFHFCSMNQNFGEY